jgi:hypothetical protein
LAGCPTLGMALTIQKIFLPIAFLLLRGRISGVGQKRVYMSQYIQFSYDLPQFSFVVHQACGVALLLSHLYFLFDVMFSFLNSYSSLPTATSNFSICINLPTEEAEWGISEGITCSEHSVAAD